MSVYFRFVSTSCCIVEGEEAKSNNAFESLGVVVTGDWIVEGTSDTKSRTTPRKNENVSQQQMTYATPMFAPLKTTTIKAIAHRVRH